MTHDTLNHEEPPRWVLERARCNLALKFQALHDVVERDVEDANALPEMKAAGVRFDMETELGGTKPVFGVKRIDRKGEGPVLYFVRESRTIRIADQFEVTVRWEASTAACRLLIEEKPYEIWEISQKVLAPLFFGESQ